MREQGLQIFTKAFKRFRCYDDNGCLVQQSVPTVLLQYSAQIETILVVNLKNYATNYPSINKASFKLVQQFLSLTTDPQLIRKQLSLLSAPLLSSIKLPLSATYSEESHTSQHIYRLRVLASLVLQGHPLETQHRQILSQHYLAAISDNLVVLGHRLSKIKTYNKLFLVYSTDSLSYDQTLHYKTFPTLLQFYLFLQSPTPEPTSDPALSSIIASNDNMLYSPEQASLLVFSAIVFLLTSNEPMDQQRKHQLTRAKSIADSQILAILQ